MKIDKIEIKGVLIAKDGLHDFAKFPVLKPFSINNWADENTVEVDLSNPKLASKEIALPLIFENQSLYHHFCKTIATGYHTFEIENIGTYKLRYKRETNHNSLKRLISSTFIFSEDTPLDGYTYQTPTGTRASQSFFMDGRNLSEYGITITKGTKDSIRANASVKKNLTIESNHINGVKYYGDNSFNQSKEIKIFSHIKLPVASFWLNHKAFLHELIKPNTRSFTTPYGNFTAYYKGNNISNFTIIKGIVWCDYTLLLKTIQR